MGKASEIKLRIVQNQKTNVTMKKTIYRKHTEKEAENLDERAKAKNSNNQ